MIDLRVNSLLVGGRWLAAAALVLAGLTAAPAVAREPPVARFAARMTPAEEQPVPVDVRVDRLSTVDADSAGVLTAADGGFGADMWQGTRRSLVEALLPRLPVDTGSRAMRQLMRRLLLSAAGAPEGGGSAPGGLVALRARMLLAMGDLDGVERLLDAASDRTAAPDLARIRTDALLLAGDDAGACASAGNQIAEASAVYWQKVLIFCQALAGEHDKAALGVALLNEMGEDDPAFFALVAALAGGPGRIDSLPDPTPLHLAMARAAKVTLPADVVSSHHLAVLGAIAVAPNATAQTRLEAADRAQAAGALSAEILRRLYAGIPGDPPAASASKVGTAGDGPRGRARGYRAAVAEVTPEARAEAVARALKAAREQGRYGATALVYLPLLAGIPPSPGSMRFAPEVIAALLVAGDWETAEDWYTALTATAEVDPRAGAALLAATPLAHLAWAADSEGWDPADLAAWWSSIRDSAGAGERATRIYTLLDATGVAVPEPLWEPLLDGAERSSIAIPSAALLERLAAAAAAGRTGETVLLALLALAEGGPAATDATTLGQVVRSLGAIGLEDEARALALEAVAASR